jgi:hypothetical protein
MAETRLRIQKNLEKSAIAGSIVKTDALFEQEYLSPGANTTILTVVGGVPVWQAPVTQGFTLTDGVTSEVIENGNTLTVTSGDGITATVSATDALDIAVKLSTDANNSLSFSGVDGGLFFDAPDNLSGAVWNDVNNTLDLTFDVNGTPTVVPIAIADAVGTFLADFTFTGDAGTDLVSNHESVNFEGGDGIGTIVTANNIEINLDIRKELFDAIVAGTTTILAATPVQIISVTRNGLEMHITHDYTLLGATLTWVTAFGISVGAAGSETVSVTYIV